jgi:hypothetical protein
MPRVSADFSRSWPPHTTTAVNKSALLFVFLYLQSRSFNFLPLSSIPYMPAVGEVVDVNLRLAFGSSKKRWSATRQATQAAAGGGGGGGHGGKAGVAPNF